LATQPGVDQAIHHAGSFRILGGKVAATVAYPFMVSLRTYRQGHACGGTIVNNLWILTSAHCMYGESIASIFAVVGTNTLNSGGIEVEIRKIVMHPNYNDTGYESNDIALIKLDSALNYSATVAPVTLDTDVSQSIIHVTLIGWGETRNKGPPSNKLRELSTKTISQAACSQYWSDLVSPNQICTKFQSGKGFCGSDSGGPLIRTNSKTQVGIASFNFEGGCGRVLPDVFTRVSKFLPWIQSTIHSQN
ncbi:hypothetical protein Trydic_g15230, partial [Trypoxylus dichotomus]